MENDGKYFRCGVLSHTVFDGSISFLIRWPDMVRTLSKIFSLAGVLRAPRPRSFLEEELTKLLKKRLKQLDIVWNPKAFRGGLSNSQLPPRLLEKLESLLIAAEISGWDISNQLRHELDETVEDIESFNPAFRKRLAREHAAALRDIKAGRFVTQEELERKLGIANA